MLVEPAGENQKLTLHSVEFFKFLFLKGNEICDIQNTRDKKQRNDEGTHNKESNHPKRIMCFGKWSAVLNISTTGFEVIELECVKIQRIEEISTAFIGRVA